MNVLLGVTGSISAYKAAILVRLMKVRGWAVQVVMSPDAGEFITPLTLSTLSQRPAFSGFIIGENGEWVNHVELALWADLMIIAPCSANTLAKLASGQADNLLLCVWMSARCPRFIAPAMDHDMYLYPATQRNLSTLEADGFSIIPPEEGELASGLHGMGRLAPPESIIEILAHSRAEGA